MGSSKKKGQQRKAAAKRAQSTETMASSINNSVSSGDAISGGSNSKIVAKVRRGNNYATKKLSFTSQFKRFRAAEMLAERGFRNLSYEQSGILSIVLDFLNRCEDDTFHQVVSSVGGDLKSPASWIDILVSACIAEPSCTLQIVENISPLVRCMCNDTARQLFKSNKHWKQGIVSFVNLITNVTEYNVYEDKKVIVEALLQHEGLLASIVQWAFWMEYRPDIVKELKAEGIAVNVIAKISNNTSGIVKWLIDGMELLGKESKFQLLETIGSTSVISREYDTSCLVSYTSGLVCGLQAVAEIERPLTTEEESQRDGIFSIVQSLILYGDCVDKEVVTDMIDLGLNYAPNYIFSLNVTILSFRMTQGTIENELRLNADNPSDTRIATAIRAGLIEMCLGFIKQFERTLRDDNNGLSMHDLIRCIFKSISKVSLHQKTAKAIRSKRSSIEKELGRLQQNTSITSNTEYKKLLDMVRSILDINGRFCCRCNKQLSKTEVMECNGCGCMVYCSEACQKDDWFNGGHKLVCCKSPFNEELGFFQGRFVPKEVPSDQRVAAKLENVEKNLTMVQLKLFLDNSETILNLAAKELDLPLYDCIVHFDLRGCPLRIEVHDYRKDFTAAEGRKGFEENRSKDKIMCVYYSQIYIEELKDCVVIQRLFPHEWLTNIIK